MNIFSFRHCPYSPTHSKMDAKRKKVVLTIETKLRLIEHYEKGDIVFKLAKEYNIGLQTVQR